MKSNQQERINALIGDRSPLELAVAKEAIKTSDDLLGGTPFTIAMLARGFADTDTLRQSDLIARLFGPKGVALAEKHREETAEILITAAETILKKSEEAQKQLSKFKQAQKQQRQTKQLTA